MSALRMCLCLVVLLTGCNEYTSSETVAASGQAITSEKSDANLDHRVHALRARVTFSGRERALPQMHNPTNDPGRADWVRPLPEVLPALLARAEAGEIEAAFVLGERLSRCYSVLLDRTPTVVLDEYEQELTWAGLDPEHDADDVRLRNLENRTMAALDDHVECTAAGAEVERAAEWLETAALAGHARARVNYATGALAEFASRGALIRNIEEIARRRTLARRWLEAGVHAGDEMALNRYVDSLRKGDVLYPRNPHKAQVYGYAQQLLRSRRVGQFDALWRDGPTRAPDFDDAAWAAILMEGRELFDSTFRDALLYPR